MKPKTHLWSAMAYCALLLPVVTTDADAQAYQAFNLASSEPVAASRNAFAINQSEFARNQLRFSRVQRASVNAQPRIAQLFQERNIRYPAAELFVRVFKREFLMEIWVRPMGADQFELLETYEICALAGKPGPKMEQGDYQVPEGFYRIDLFNPSSEYHLSMRINYPNTRDRMANRGRRLGGDIFIHGDCVSAGCLAMTDNGIEELYWLAVQARAVGQTSIPVHIFPSRLSSDEMDRLDRFFADQPELVDFWETLKPGYDYFEQNRRLPRVGVDPQGRYRLSQVEN